jgi:hypothetical protein
MKNLIVKNKWEYNINDTMKKGDYGFTLTIYKNNDIVYKQAGFGSIQGAEAKARRYFLEAEFNLDLDLDENS